MSINGELRKSEGCNYERSLYMIGDLTEICREARCGLVESTMPISSLIGRICFDWAFRDRFVCFNFKTRPKNP